MGYKNCPLKNILSAWFSPGVSLEGQMDHENGNCINGAPHNLSSSRGVPLKHLVTVVSLGYQVKTDNRKPREIKAQWMSADDPGSLTGFISSRCLPEKATGEHTHPTDTTRGF